MKPALYRSMALQSSCIPHLRPGGEQLSRRILELTRPGNEDCIADIGCGRGTTLSLFAGKGFTRLIGLDCDEDFATETGCAQITGVCGKMEKLPFRDNSIDLLLCECAWNLSGHEQSLREFARVIKPGGQLALADIFLHSQVDEEWPIQSCLASASTLEKTKKRVRESGFSIEHLEDHSHLIRQAAAEFIFAHGSLAEFWYAVTGSKTSGETLCRLTNHSKPGLFILSGRLDNE